MRSAGRRRHFVTLANPSTPVPDGDGSYTQDPEALNPASVYAEIVPATAHDLERLMVGTVISEATHVLTMPYHAQVTTQTMVTFNGRTLRVTGVMNPDERNRETICACVEVVQ